MCRKPIEKAHRNGDGLLAGEESALTAGIVELVGEVPPQGIVKLFENACGAVDVSGRGGKR